MRRVAAIALMLVIAPGAFVLAGAGDSAKHYRVRAIFDSAAFVVAGEDVKAAGVKVGKIDDVELTPDNRAAVVIDITEPGFQDFRRDATCKIRPQSLIGEQFVECSPTQPRAGDEEAPPELPVIEDGENKGQRLLPVENTSISVGLDLIGDSLRLPQRQKLSLILSELGIGLAGRGGDLNDVVRRSAPALQELDKVLDLLATQNETLEQLAVDSDTIMAPLARERERVSGFIDSSSQVARATADRRAELEATLQRLPRFLDELRPTMQRLGSLADEMTPVVSDLRVAAPDLDNLLREMGPFSRAATPALEGLGDVAEPGIPAIKGALPIVKDLRALGRQLQPTAATLGEVLTSFQRNEGLERLMDYILYQALAVNGFDSVSHFLRAGLLVNTCSTYATTPGSGCAANFLQTETARATAAGKRKSKREPRDEAKQPASGDTGAPAADAKPTETAAPTVPLTPEATAAPAEPEPTASPETVDQLLDYLFGADE